MPFKYKQRYRTSDIDPTYWYSDNEGNRFTLQDLLTTGVPYYDITKLNGTEELYDLWVSNNPTQLPEITVTAPNLYPATPKFLPRGWSTNGLGIGMRRIAAPSGTSSELWRPVANTIPKLLPITWFTSCSNGKCSLDSITPDNTIFVNDNISLTEDGRAVPSWPFRRIRDNTSPTAKDTLILSRWSFLNSTEHENAVNKAILSNLRVINSSYIIPFILDKTIKVNGNYISENLLDSVAKYAGLAQIPIQWGLGLLHESMFGSVPTANTVGALKHTKKYRQSEDKLTKELEQIHDRILLNSNYFRNYGLMPSEYLVRDWEYFNLNNKDIPVLLHAFDYFDRGLYNSGDSNHTTNTIKYGNGYFLEEAVLDWWRRSGKELYDLPTTPLNKAYLEFLEERYKDNRRKHTIK